MRNLIIGIYVFAITFALQISWSSLGLNPIDSRYLESYPIALQIIFIGVFVYFVAYFFLFATIGVRLHKRFRTYLINKIKGVAIAAPINAQEYAWWTLNSFTAIFEELAYRGFFFFFMLHFWPELSIWIIGVMSVLLEAVRYAPRMAAMRYVAIRAAVFTLAFIVFHSLYAAILLHVLYNLRMMAVPFHWARNDQQQSKAV